MKETSEINTALAMFASNNKPQSHFCGNNGQFGGNGQSNFVNYNRGRGRRNNHRGRGGGKFNPSFSTPQPHQQQFSQSSSFNPQQQFSTKIDSSRPQCQICGKLGHLAIDYYQRMNFAYQDKNPPSKLAAMAATNNPSQVEEMWLTDTGAIDHITANTNNFTTQAPYNGSDQVVVGNGQNLPINTIGNTHLYTQTHKFCLNNVLHVLEIASNLLSVNKLCHDNNCSCYFDSHKFSVQDLPMRKILYKGLSENGVYPIYSSKLRHLRAISQLSSHVHSSVYTSIKSNNTGTTSASSTKNWLL